jgi:hypothetical protein
MTTKIKAKITEKTTKRVKSTKIKPRLNSIHLNNMRLFLLAFVFDIAFIMG